MKRLGAGIQGLDITFQGLGCSGYQKYLGVRRHTLSSSLMPAGEYLLTQVTTGGRHPSASGGFLEKGLGV